MKPHILKILGIDETFLAQEPLWKDKAHIA